MKRILAFCFVAFISISVSVGTEMYVEKFISSERAHLNNLTILPSMAAAFPGVAEDVPGFGLKDSAARSGRIHYQVQGASQVTVQFFSVNSSYACCSEDQWIIGMPDPEYKGEMLPVYMDSTGALYIHNGMSWCQLQKKDATPWAKSTFNPVSQAPESTVPLNVAVSIADSSGHTELVPGSTSRPFPMLKYGSIVGYYEEHTYTIPDNATELMIDLNYPWENRDLSGDPIAAPLTGYPVVINKIQIEGEDLVFDQKSPDPDHSSSGSGNGGDEDHSNDEIILPDNDPESTKSDQTEMPVTAGVSSSQSDSGIDRKSHSDNSRTGGKKTDSGNRYSEKTDHTPFEPESETLLYQTDRDSVRDKLFSLMLAGYGVIGLGIAWQIYRHTVHRNR